eukprot:TRINITY_DN5302_c2_g1_i2.p1 TRINITY_DN5302_c2_g1~~TRINITY_DN5302_c2_g1_i2.p1  ORF type:complete len:289 (+),score=73.17 TRINITY_DN5302_c2_g1_i2:70-936(+)
MTSNESEIKTMRLYTDLDRIENELLAMGYEAGSKVKAEDIHKVSMMSYGGVEGCKNVVKELKVVPGNRVLDLGCGAGGPARVLSEVAGGCSVTGIEFQKDLCDLAAKLTSRCDMDDKVSFINADATDPLFIEKVGSTPYDHMISWLAILHIDLQSRTALWKNVHQSLKPGGCIYIEDFYCCDDATFSEAHRKMLDVDVSIPNGVLCTRSQYEADLKKAGFKNIIWTDVTSEWTSFVSSRLAAFVSQKEKYIKTHNQTTFDNMSHFFLSVVTLFKESDLKGVRIIATRE